MKSAVTFFFIVCSVIFAVSSSTAQTPAGPFNDLIDKEINSSNIFLMWQESVPGSGLHAFQKVYFVAPGSQNLPADQKFTDIPAKQDDRPVGGNRHMVVTPGKFVVSPYDYVIAAWEGENQTIEIMVPHMDTTEVMWNSHTAFTVEGPVVPADGNNERGRIFVKSGDLNGNGLDEFALAYHGADSTIHIQVYDLDTDLSPRLLASVNDEPLLPTPIENARISVAVGDLTGNGRDEIILASVEQIGAQSWAWGIYVKVYELNDTNTLAEIAREIIFYSDPDELQISGMDIAVGTGNFRDESRQDIVLAFTFSTNAFEDDTFIYLVEADKTQGVLLFDDSKRVTMQKSVNERGIIGLAVGDLNQEGYDEFVFAIAGSFDIYSVDGSLNPVFRSAGPIPDDDRQRLSYDFVAIDNIDRSERPEVIVARNIFDQNSSEQWFEIVAYAFHDSGNGVLDSLELKGRKLFDQPSEINGAGSARRYAIATGSFNGYNFKLGQPIYSVATNIVQPLVILNAPPVHFDIFDGVTYDVNRCYSGTPCNFIASYEKISTNSVEVSTVVEKDWGISAGLGVSGSTKIAPFGVGVDVNFEAYFDYTHGRNFRNVDTESQTLSVAFAVDAVEDDIIYATVADYHFWEYPAYYGNEAEPRYYVLAVEPMVSDSRWFPSKSWSANSHIPNHEVGNILSYTPYTNLQDNPDADQNIRASYTSDTFVLDANTNYSWSLLQEDFMQNQADTSRRNGFDTKLRAGIRFAADFTKTKASTHTISVKEDLEIKTQLGGIDRTFGETRYHVTPYAYWSNNGALVVDYAVRPEISGPGGSNTWWDDRYGQLPDPAFILPWRYDPEKGFAMSEEAKRHQTQDVFFDYNEPEPVDTLTITARVRNFSLVNSPPVTVHFYVGDPDEGGTPITDVNGESSFTTGEGITAQRFTDVDIQWLVPAGIGQFPRIYAVLNKDVEYDEIHTNNNKGFNILGQSAVTTSLGEIAENRIPDSFELYQSYPNPFNPAATIGFQLPEQADVRFEVFNMLGQRVSVLVNEHKSAGYHEVRFDASHLASGMYIYRITTGTYSRAGKMLLLK